MRTLGFGLAVATLFCGTAAWGQSSDTPNIIFDGFGTLGLVYSDEDQADFVSNSLSPDGAGHSDRISPEVDSRLGLQLTAEMTPRLTAVGQVVFEQRYDDTYQPTLEWANLKYDLTEDLSVRGGRVVLPTFMTAQYRKVGYALPWVRPPQEVYAMQPVTNLDGIELSWRTRFHGFTNTLQAVYGGIDLSLPGGAGIESRNLVSISNSLDWGAGSLFASYATSLLTIEALNPLFDAFRQFGPEGERIADRYDIDEKRFDFFSLGVRYDPGQWFVQGEWSATRNRTFLADSRGMYLSGGYRIGTFTPYLTLARVRAASETSSPGLPLTGLPEPVASQVRQLNATLNTLLGSAPEQKSLTVGARWDFARNFALKLQFDHLDLDKGSAGVLINEQPGFRRGGSVSLVSAAVDFVF